MPSSTCFPRGNNHGAPMLSNGDGPTNGLRLSVSIESAQTSPASNPATKVKIHFEMRIMSPSKKADLPEIQCSGAKLILERPLIVTRFSFSPKHLAAPRHCLRLDRFRERRWGRLGVDWWPLCL